MFRTGFDHAHSSFTGHLYGMFQSLGVQMVAGVDEDLLVVLHGPEVDAPGQQVLLPAGMESRLGDQALLVAFLDVVVGG